MRIKTLFAVAAIFLFAPAFAPGQTISISLDKSAYASGDTMHISISATNGSSDKKVDLYFVLLTPQNTLLFFPTWTGEINGLKGIVLPANLNIPDTEVFTYNLPSLVPLIQDSGNYTFAMGLASPGTFNFLSLDTAPFTYTAGEKRDIAFLIVDLERDYSGSQVEESAWINFGAYEFEVGEDPDSVCPPLEGCVFNKYEYSLTEPPPNVGGTFSKGLDAGEKILVTGSPNGNIYLNRTPMPYYPGYYYEPERELVRSDFTFDSDYWFTGTGGVDVGAFNEKVTSLSDFEVISPELGTGLQIERNKSLDITWTNPLGSPYEVHVMISSTSFDLINMKSVMTLCQCRFIDDGEGMVPSGMLLGLVVPSSYLGSSSIEITKVLQGAPEIGGIEGKTESSITEKCDCQLK